MVAACRCRRLAVLPRSVRLYSVDPEGGGLATWVWRTDYDGTPDGCNEYGTDDGVDVYPQTSFVPDDESGDLVERLLRDAVLLSVLKS